MLAVGMSLACAPAAEQAPPVDPATLNAAVDTLLSQSEAAWNGGDLEGFLLWYQRGPETTFLGSTGLTRGWETIRARYAARFEAGAARDSLRFEDLVTRPLAPRLGLATARYVLFQGDSVTASGVFTLIVEQKPEGWRIVHDHSSADSN
jgi:beta-aspartyl-peptidase (threonine type)